MWHVSFKYLVPWYPTSAHVFRTTTQWDLSKVYSLPFCESTSVFVPTCSLFLDLCQNCSMRETLAELSLNLVDFCCALGPVLHRNLATFFFPFLCTSVLYQWPKTCVRLFCVCVVWTKLESCASCTYRHDVRLLLCQSLRGCNTFIKDLWKTKLAWSVLNCRLFIKLY